MTGNTTRRVTGKATGKTTGKTTASKLCGVLLAMACIVGSRAAHAGEPREIHQIEVSLDAMDKALDQASSMTWVRAYTEARTALFDEGSPAKASPRHAELVKRFRTAVAAAGQTVGPRAAKLIAEESREGQAREEAVEVLSEAIKLCGTAVDRNHGAFSIKELDLRIADYEKKLARAIKIDPRVVKLGNKRVGPNGDDVPAELAACELSLAFLKIGLEDDPPVAKTPLDGERKSAKGCGFIEYELRSLKMGNRWGAWEASGNESYSRPLACKQFPRGVKAPSAAIKQALLGAFSTAKGGSVYEQYFEGDERSGLQYFRRVDIRVYAKDVMLRESACKEMDPVVVCAVSGEGSSAVIKYDNARFRLARAEARKKSGNVTQCKRLIKDALDDARQFKDYFDSARRGKSLDDKIRYKTADAILSLPELETKMAVVTATAESRHDAGWCDK